jgi:hypothetical protein
MSCDEQKLRSSFVEVQLQQPGCWDGRMLNKRGEPYAEAVHGLDPLARGFSYSAPVPVAGAGCLPHSSEP